ncbi:MAG: VOC family protein [Verrucomicrobiota bacterium]
MTLIFEGRMNGEPTVLISLTFVHSDDAIRLYINAFEAVELYRIPTPQGKIIHAEILIGNSKILLSDEFKELGIFAAKTNDHTPFLFPISVDSCDDAYMAAVDAGAISLKEPIDELWGARSATVKDPFGYRWSLVEKKEDLSYEDICQRAKAIFD